nr:basic proline-rich protein-like [Delphinus delphis]
MRDSQGEAAFRSCGRTDATGICALSPEASVTQGPPVPRGSVQPSPVPTGQSGLREALGKEGRGEVSDQDPPQGAGRGSLATANLGDWGGGAGSGVGFGSYLTPPTPRRPATRVDRSPAPSHFAFAPSLPSARLSRPAGLPEPRLEDRPLRPHSAWPPIWRRRDLASPASRLSDQSRNLPRLTTFRGSRSSRSGAGPRGPDHAPRPSRGEDPEAGRRSRDLNPGPRIPGPIRSERTPPPAPLTRIAHAGKLLGRAGRWLPVRAGPHLPAAAHTRLPLPPGAARAGARSTFFVCSASAAPPPARLPVTCLPPRPPQVRPANEARRRRAGPGVLSEPRPPVG